MKKGITRSIIFYVIGYAAVLISFLTVEPQYHHAPPPFFFILFLVAAIGVIWLTISYFTYIFKKSKSSIGYILVNGIHTLIFGTVFLIVVNMDWSEESVIDNSRVVKTKQVGDTTYIYHQDNIIYIEVADSVLLDLR